MTKQLKLHLCNGVVKYVSFGMVKIVQCPVCKAVKK